MLDRLFNLLNQQKLKRLRDAFNTLRGKISIRRSCNNQDSDDSDSNFNKEQSTSSYIHTRLSYTEMASMTYKYFDKMKMIEYNISVHEYWY